MTTEQFADELRKWWAFDDRQHHAHSWHTREDFIKDKLPELLNLARSEQAEKDARIIAHARKMSDALCKVRPLGGSEMFVRIGDNYYADPVHCGSLIDELRAENLVLRCTADAIRKGGQS